MTTDPRDTSVTLTQPSTVAELMVGLALHSMGNSAPRGGWCSSTAQPISKAERKLRAKRKAIAKASKRRNRRK